MFLLFAVSNWVLIVQKRLAPHLVATLWTGEVEVVTDRGQKFKFLSSDLSRSCTKFFLETDMLPVKTIWCRPLKLNFSRWTQFCRGLEGARWVVGVKFMRKPTGIEPVHWKLAGIDPGSIAIEYYSEIQNTVQWDFSGALIVELGKRTGRTVEIPPPRIYGLIMSVTMSRCPRQALATKSTWICMLIVMPYRFQVLRVQLLAK